MKCPICNSETEYYFSKTYTEAPFDEFMRDIGTVDYHRCKNCGFVISKTHIELSTERWITLNSECHHYFEDPKNVRKDNTSPYAEQALMLVMLGKHGIIDVENWLDYASGYGRLSRFLEKYFQMHLPIYDQYVRSDESSRYVHEAHLNTYNTVINAAMFEHITSRNELDKVHQLVSNEGCLILHTVVCETVPKDPDWFYIRTPSHCAFHTNKSMSILMEQWGYVCSIYSPKSKCWVLLKQKDSQLLARINALNEELQSQWFYFKDGFMDYWKGF